MGGKPVAPGCVSGAAGSNGKGVEPQPEGQRSVSSTRIWG